MDGLVGGMWRVEWVGGWKGDLVVWVGWLLDGCVRGWVDGLVGRVGVPDGYLCTRVSAIRDIWT